MASHRPMLIRCYVCFRNLSGLSAKEKILVKGSPVPLSVWNEFFKGSLIWTEWRKVFCISCHQNLLDFQKAHDQMMVMKEKLLKGAELPSHFRPEHNRKREVPAKPRRMLKLKTRGMSKSIATRNQPQWCVSSAKGSKSGSRRMAQIRARSGAAPSISQRRGRSSRRNDQEGSHDVVPVRVGCRRREKPRRYSPSEEGPRRSRKKLNVKPQEEGAETDFVEEGEGFSLDRVVSFPEPKEEGSADWRTPLVLDEDAETEENEDFTEVKVRGEVKLVCKKCENEFTSKEEFSVHFEFEHQGGIRDVSGMLANHFDEDELGFPRETLRSSVSVKEDSGATYFSCNQCTKQYKTLEQLKKHALKTHVTASYSCPVCPTVCRLRLHYRRHLREHEAKGEAVFKCDICGFILDTYDEFMRHRSKHKEVTYDCRYCQKEFPTRTQRHDHYMTHAIERPFQCGECDERFEFKKNLRVHQKLHLNPRRLSYKCDLCEGEFPTRGERKKHQTSEHAACHECGNSDFDTFESLVRHYRAVHNSRDGRFACERCPKRFNVLPALTRHQVCVHGDPETFLCSACGVVFSDRTNLRTHFNRFHSEEAKFSCSVCSQIFGNSTLLRRHVERAHEKQKKYCCEYCLKTFIYPTQLARHRSVHTLEKKWPCEFCGKRFTSWSNRHAHLYSHVNKRPFECRHCGAGFMRQNKTELHVLHEHGIGSRLALDNSIIRNNPFRYNKGKVEVISNIVEGGSQGLGLDIRPS